MGALGLREKVSNARSDKRIITCLDIIYKCYKNWKKCDRKCDGKTWKSVTHAVTLRLLQETYKRK